MSDSKRPAFSRGLAAGVVAAGASLGLCVAATDASLLTINNWYTVDGGTLTSNASNTGFRGTGGEGAIANLGENLSLLNVGDYVEMRYLLVQNSHGNNQRDTVRFGLFSNNGNPVTADDDRANSDQWVGYYPSLSTRNAGTNGEHMHRQDAGTAIVMSRGTGGGVTTMGGTLGSGINAGLVNEQMSLRIERTATGLEITGGPWESNNPGSFVVRTDNGPVTLDFNALGIGYANSGGSGGMIVTNIEVETNLAVSNPFVAPTPGAFQLVENFSAGVAGNNLNTLSNWTSSTGDGGFAIVAEDPDDPTNLVGRVGNRSVRAKMDLGSLGVEEGDSGTLFMRARFDDFQSGSNRRINFGLGDDSIARPIAGGAFEQALVPLDGGTSEGLLGDVWYNLWVVIDHDLDLYGIYAQSDDDANYEQQTLLFYAPFSQLAFGDDVTLDQLVFFSDNQPNTTKMYFDDVYLSLGGMNLINPLFVTDGDAVIPEPGTALLGLAGMAGLAMLRRRREV